MGSSSSREGRGPESPTPYGQQQQQQSDSGGPAGTSGNPADRQQSQNVYGSRTTGRSRPDLSFLGIGSSNTAEPAPAERRESKQERERRKLEKERAARIKERERSLQEEHVDGGYLVTMGVYTGVEDFNKVVVRQLMIERRIAPFWRGLDDFRDEWTEHQLVAAGRGLPIPKADDIPEEEPTQAGESAEPLSSQVHNLTVPINSRSHSVGSDASTLSPSHPAFSSSNAPTSPSSHSPFRPRSKTLASLTTSRNSSADIVPREIQLPKDGFVNGQAIEVFLYKAATECPICFLYYPPYLNKTRCCDQPICSECFVQIKRPEPHPPEHEHNDPSNPAPPPTDANVDPESLVSEPAACPYCQQAEFGVTYEVPPFRRGLAYANSLGGFSSAMSSSSSLHSAASPGFAPQVHKRRTTSISANASTVVTTDRVRPDWATKLANARSHLARRSAAATALHTAAYLIGSGTPDPRGFGFSSRSRFGRSRGDSTPASGAATPSPIAGEHSRSDNANEIRRETQAATGRHRHRMEDLEEMMMAEAIRLSLAAEEDRKRKEDKEAAKEAKKKAKEEKKREKKEKKVYGSGPSSASASTMSLSLHMGRRRGNSAASNVHHQTSSESAAPLDIKGKGVDRGTTNATNQGFPGARHLDTNTFGTISDMPSPSPTAPDKPSHLRQMSSASSPASSYDESNQGSLRNEFHSHGTSSTIDTPNASGTHLEGSGGTAAGGTSAAGVSPESMFNFHSLVAMIGKDDSDDKEDLARHIEHLGGAESTIDGRHDGPAPALEESVATLRVSDSPPQTGVTNGDARQSSTLLEQQRLTPEVTLTPETPAANSHDEDDGKQLGASWDGAVVRQVTQ